MFQQTIVNHVLPTFSKVVPITWGLSYLLSWHFKEFLKETVNQWIRETLVQIPGSDYFSSFRNQNNVWIFSIPAFLPSVLRIVLGTSEWVGSVEHDVCASLVAVPVRPGLRTPEVFTSMKTRPMKIQTKSQSNLNPIQIKSKSKIKFKFNQPRPNP